MCLFCRSKKWKKRLATSFIKRQCLVVYLPASGGWYSKSNQESAYDFHPLCHCFLYSPNQPDKKEETVWMDSKWLIINKTKCESIAFSYS